MKEDGSHRNEGIFKRLKQAAVPLWMTGIAIGAIQAGHTNTAHAQELAPTSQGISQESHGISSATKAIGWAAFTVVGSAAAGFLLYKEEAHTRRMRRRSREIELQEEQNTPR